MDVLKTIWRLYRPGAAAAGRRRRPEPREQPRLHAAAGGGGARARSRRRFAPPLIHFIPESLTYLAPLFLSRRCGRTLGGVRQPGGARAAAGAFRSFLVRPAAGLFHRTLNTNAIQL